MEKSSSKIPTSLNNPLDLFSLFFACAFKSNISTLFHCSKFLCFDKIEDNSDQNTIKSCEVGKKNLMISKEKSDDNFLFGDDINMVMQRLGIEHNILEGEELRKKWSKSELSDMFEEEPSLEEVKEAFDVFDQNKDGFIEAEDLQRVLTALGLSQGYELHQCRNMIRAFDQNADSKIDFNEFVNFMLNTL